MRVLVTGATGFLGSQIAASLQRAGYPVRGYVRDAAKYRSRLARHGLTAQDWSIGEITDRKALGKALAGCSAVVHCAAAVSTHRRDRQAVWHTNVTGSRYVLEEATSAGLQHIVHLSSVAAIFNAGADRLTGEEAPARPDSSYGRSKAAAEEIARDLQAQGAPLAILYPAAIAGPLDPGLSAPHEGIRIFLRRIGVATSSGIQIIDVRDIASVVCHLLTLPAMPPRVTLGGHYYRWEELLASLQKLTGRRLWKLPVPGPLLRGVGHLGDLYTQVTGHPTPVNAEATLYATRWVPTDDFIARSLGLAFTPPEDTLREAILSMRQNGYLTASEAGLLG